jgi:serine/threonine-protein kinase HipA
MKELSVIYRGFGETLPLGTLADDGRQVLFQYSPQALAHQLELSPLRMPLRTIAYPDKPGDYRHLRDVPGLIHDSLPDGWGFRLMHRRMKVRGLDPQQITTLDSLAYLGENTMGALVYAPPREESASAKDLTLMELAHEVQAVLRDDGRLVLAELARAGGSPGGARPKAQVYFNLQTLAVSTQASQVPDGEAWLVKFAGDDDAPDSCAVEELYARLARACGLDMSPTHLFELPGGQAFGTRRFDRRGNTRVHVHSLAGLLHADFRVPSVSYEDFFRATRRLTRDRRELVKAFKVCAFNVLMNNRDDHARNLSFMREADGRWLLAPPYDLTYCAGYRAEHFMDVAGEGKAPARGHLLAAAAKAGLPSDVASRHLDDMLERITPDLLLQATKELPLRAITVKTVHSAVRGNHARLVLVA